MNLRTQARTLALSCLLATAHARAQSRGPVTSLEATPRPQRIDLTTGSSGEPLQWTASNPAAWSLTTPGLRPTLALAGVDDRYTPPYRSPRRIALADGATFGDFRLTVEAQQTSREYGHRDLCVVFGFQAPDRFYYVHFATTPDQSACNLFLVDGAARRPLAPVPARGVDWGAALSEGAEPPWRALTVERQGDRLRAWFEGELVLEARDATLGAGLIGLGSFDDSGRFRDLVVTGAPGPPSTSPFPAVATRATPAPGTTWPAGAGPRGDWSTTGPAAPLTFDANTGEHVLWRAPLPATGQGGIAVHSGRVFVTTMRPWDASEALTAEDAARFQHATEGRAIVGKHVLARCHDADTGALLWERELQGEVPAIHSYPFSDATSASPVTDGAHVWFTNAAGRVACFTLDGAPVWERTYTPAFDGPFNKQFEPFLVQDGARDVLVHMEPFPAPGAAPEALAGRWHHLVGLDAATGDVLWRSADALTQYNAPTLVATDDGMCALVGRGGPHDVPERPVGVSLVRLNGARAGTSVWRYEDPRGNHEAALHVMAHDERYAYWVLRDPASAIIALDLATGAEVASVALNSGVTQTTFDAAAGTWRSAANVDLDRGVFPARYSAHAANGWVYFQCYDTAFGRATLAPSFSFGRADVVHGRVEYLEVPTDIARDERGARRFVWRAPRPARALDRRGVEVTGDERSRWSGWDWVFNGAPTRVNDRLSYTLANGLVYTFDARATAFNGDALLAVNELGPAGGVWSASSMTYANGRLYHRTGAELLCFGLAPGPD